MKGINYSRLDFKIELGNQELTNKVNPNTGERVSDFVAKRKIWAAQWSFTVNQNLSLQGLGIKNAVGFVIRHKSLIEQYTYVKYGSELYRIQNIDVDDGSQSNGFDLITCTKEVINHA
ncbi:head-tail adaptor protein [Pediococcus stilesii]|uniref:Head-tail adaptor protein n=1 Tax=Pediococcus stilesii TaxID=331679 RepID=A0A5R9BSF6_9LACO|nr:phage head closure protein [Pediococcus stilesii]TLQ03646.1 head-tail adaptor protein [Pediococcus stilesii]